MTTMLMMMTTMMMSLWPLAHHATVHGSSAQSFLEACWGSLRGFFVFLVVCILEVSFGPLGDLLGASRGLSGISWGPAGGVGSHGVGGIQMSVRVSLLGVLLGASWASPVLKR